MSPITGCSQESHAKAKAERSDTLVFHDFQFDEDGRIALVWVDCTACGSTLALPPDAADPAHHPSLQESAA